MLKDQFRYAVNGLFHRRLRSWLTMLGIFIGIAAIISLIGLGEGLRVAINAQFGFVGVDVLTVQASGIGFAGPPGTGVVTPLTQDLSDKIEGLNGVEAAIPRYIDSGIIEFNGVQGMGFIMSLPSGERRDIGIRVLNLEAESGRLLEGRDNRKLLLGNNFKEDDSFGKGIVVGDRVSLNDAQFEVVGLLEKKGSFLFDNIIILTEENMFDTLETNEEEVSVIAVVVKDINQINDVKKDIEKLLRKERGVKEGEEDFSVESPQATLESLNSSLFAIQLFVYIIASISLLVGGIGIMNTMYTSVLERTKEIGIMKSIGAKNRDIMVLFVLESGLLGMLGGIIGVILGWGIAKLGGGFAANSGYAMLQPYFPWYLTAGCILFAFIIGTLAGVLPAKQASKLKPVDALRYE